MNISPVVFIAVAAFAFSCKASKESSKTKEVIGADDRVLITDQEMRSRIGVLDTGDRQCNAFLIGGNKIITVAHCLQEKANQFVDFKFTTFSGKSSRIKGLQILDASKDTVVYELMSSDFKYFPMGKESPVGAKISVAGFDPETASELQSSCTISDKITENALISYECDTRPGMSGSVVLRDGFAVGMHIGYYKSRNLNVAFDFNAVDPDADVGKLTGLSFEWPPKSPHIRPPSHVRVDWPKPGELNCIQWFAHPFYAQTVLAIHWARDNQYPPGAPVNDEVSCKNAAVIIAEEGARWTGNVGIGLVSYDLVRCSCEKVF